LKIEVIEEYKSSLKVNTNRAKLFYIIHNILLNAQEAMSDATVPNRRLTVTMYEDSSGKYLKISDTGVGIQKDLLNKIFDYGFTTKPGKYGYGLYSCTSYIADMGGSICAESDGEGKGASFILKFS
jgi:C4-dicarboxylate-specific signal transduction histidine kinase